MTSRCSSQDYQGVRGDPELKAAQDSYLELINRLRADNRKQFVRWCHGVEMADEVSKPAPAPEAKPTLETARPANSAVASASSTAATGVAKESPKENTNVHMGVKCDASGVSPIVGNRWKKIDHNYDLCDAEYRKLSPEVAALIRHPRGYFSHRLLNMAGTIALRLPPRRKSVDQNFIPCQWYEVDEGNSLEIYVLPNMVPI